jgi:DNA-binding transcriptional MerR regulator
MNSFTIKDLENLSGIKAHTLRIWEQRYNFIKPQRTATKIRYYTNEELKLILNISLLNKYGYKVSHISKMDETDMAEKILAINNSLAQQERIVNELIGHMIGLEIYEMESVLDSYILSRGIDKTILEIIFPFLERIGILWLTNHINPAQEHFVSNLVRQKIIVGIEGQHSPVKTSKSVLLFLPEGEHHELGLLYLHFLLKSRGIQVFYLGADIPFKDLEFVVNIKKPDYLYCHLTTGSAFRLDRFIQKITAAFPALPAVISGQVTNSFQKKTKEPVVLKRSLSEVMEFISSI